MPEVRSGLGWDLHRLVAGRPLMVGGIEIPHDRGEDGHSDGDAVLHAITDALLGAAALGDIGEMFPPSDPAWKGADSRKLLATALARVRESGWEIGNVDAVIALERPKILSHREAIRDSIAETLGVGRERVFVKAKTSEGVDAVGSGAAIACWATCLLISAEAPV